MEKFEKAAQLLRSWLHNPCRFDLYTVADRGGILREVQYLQRQLIELLDDNINIIEMYEFFVEEQAVEQNLKPGLAGWVKALTDRYFG